MIRSEADSRYLENYSVMQWHEHARDIEADSDIVILLSPSLPNFQSDSHSRGGLKHIEVLFHIFIESKYCPEYPYGFDRTV